MCYGADGCGYGSSLEPLRTDHYPAPDTGGRTGYHSCFICHYDIRAKEGLAYRQDNAEGLIYYVEGKYSTYLEKTKAKVIESAPHRAVGGWSLGSIEVRTLLVNDKKNNFYKFFNWYDIQSGYNAKNMNNIDPLPFVGCAAGSADDGGCITFTKTCADYFAKNPALNKNTAQIVKGYKHYIKYQLNYFYNAIKYFFNI